MEVRVEAQDELKQKPAYWPAPWLILSWVSHTAQARSLRDGASHNGLVHPTSVSNQDNFSDLSSSLRLPLPRRL